MDKKPLIRTDGNDVIINGVIIPGFIDDDRCKSCSEKLVYYEKMEF